MQDRRLYSPSFERNHQPIGAALAGILPDSGAVLEIGSGSGQHAAFFAERFAGLTWRPSDADAAALASCDAWREAAGVANMDRAAMLDVMVENWPIPDPPSDGFAVILSLNMIHIAPWRAAEGLFRGAARWLAADGRLLLYGPFRWSGAHISDSNAAFDQSLRQRNPHWGVRDVDDLERLAHAHGLVCQRAEPLPANNHLLIYRSDRAAS